MQGVSSSFVAAVVERFGACGGRLTGLIKILTGDQERDALRDEEYTFSTSSKTTHVASQLTFAAVMADAAMVDRVLAVDGSSDRVMSGAYTCSQFGCRGVASTPSQAY